MTRHIVACGGGGWPSNAGAGALEDYILGLARRDRPRVCLVPTASGDSDGVISRFDESFASDVCEPSHLPLFRPHPGDPRARLARADVVYVCGGSSANLAAVWAVHGVGQAMREAWEAGAVMSGVSAGAICWFAAGLTNSLGPGFAPMGGLGLVPGGFCPHADGDPARLVALRELVEAGRMPETLAVDDGAAVHIAGRTAPRLVVGAPGRGARRIGPRGIDEPLEPLALAS
jgi:peptidase E